jgi:hypothetical protein
VLDDKKTNHHDAQQDELQSQGLSASCYGLLLRFLLLLP